MGCCSSVPSSSSPYPAQQPNSSSRAINSSQPQSQAALPRPSTHASSHSNRPQSNQPLSTHINRPLKLHVWTSNTRIWTRTDLDRERTEFFDTRVTGRPEIWQTIKAVLEVIWAGGDPGDTDGGLATAQGILDAAGITLPRGDLTGGIYDSFGNHYGLPEHIASDPLNIAEVSPRLEGEGEEDKTGDEESEEAVDEEELVRRREEKGKAVVNSADLIEIKARLSDRGGVDLTITISKEDTIRLISRKILEDAGLTTPKHIRIAYMGKILKENQTLEAQGWKDDHVLNALVFG